MIPDCKMLGKAALWIRSVFRYNEGLSPNSIAS